MKHRQHLILAALLLIALPALFGLVAPAARAGDDDTYLPSNAYREALDVLKDQYYPERIDQKKAKELTYASIRGMLYTLNDPFTAFLDPEEWRQMQDTTTGTFEGIGAILEPYFQDVRVVRPIPGSPAFKAGLKSKDVVVSVDNYEGEKKVKSTNTLGKNINEVVKLIKGPHGTLVGVNVMRKGATGPIHFLIRRAQIEPPTVQYWMEDEQNKIGHILLNEFNEKSESQFDRAYEDLKGKGMRALVFDLRYNPGGLLTVAVNMGAKFIEGPVVIIQEKSGQQQKLKPRRVPAKYDVPMVLLVNEGSASASEIVAGAIKDTHRAPIVGEHTFGKGLVQTLFPLNDNSALRLTTAKYFTPSGADISNKYDEEHRPIFGTGGIKPDVEVKNPDNYVDLDFSDENKKNDLQLKKALDILRTKLASNPGRQIR